MDEWSDSREFLCFGLRLDCGEEIHKSHDPGDFRKTAVVECRDILIAANIGSYIDDDSVLTLSHAWPLR